MALLRFAAFASSSLRFSHIRRTFKSFAIPPDHDYFRHSGNTWLFNAEKQHANRYLEFNVSALIDEAVCAANASSCVHFSKLRDETANRLFEITLDNGQELIAKLPYPFAGPAHYTTASEVATMQFMRESLDLPVPEVLAWSSQSESTPVKSEFIIMENLEGKHLGDVWDDLRPVEVAQIIQGIVEVERRMTETSFHALGSLYYIKDIPRDIRSIQLSGYGPSDELYCIGPSVDRRFWRNGRGELDIDRGPWHRFTDYTRSVINCEIAWLKKYAKPHRRDSPLFRSETENDPETHIKLLEKYSLVSRSMNPVQEFNYLRLWHPHLHSHSILVSPIDGQYRITGILDWQGACIELLLVIARNIPECLSPPGKYVPVECESFGQVCEDFELPNNYHSLTRAQQAEAEKELDAVRRYNEYLILTEEHNPSLHEHRALVEAHLGTFPLQWASMTWDLSTAEFENALIMIRELWKLSISPNKECPISFSDSEIAANKSTMDRFNQHRDAWHSHWEIGIECDGQVSQDKLEEARRSMEVAREKYLESLPESEREDARRQWPFQDGAFSYTAETCRPP